MKKVFNTLAWYIQPVALLKKVKDWAAVHRLGINLTP